MSPLGIGGSGLVGLAFEAVRGTYLAPTKWLPVRSESMQATEDKQALTPIRGVPTASHVKPGYKIVEGDLEFEVTSDLLPYVLYAARMTPVKAGVGPFTYTFTPASDVLPTTGAGLGVRKTLSLYIERATRPFAYLGCSVTSISFSIDNGDLIASAHLMGLELDTSKAQVAATYAPYAPYGPGDIAISIPNNAARTDIDNFSIEINDNGESLNRVKAGGRGPSYIKWGEREVSGNFDHDFQDLTEYQAFVDNTFRTLRVLASHGAADSVQIDLANIISNSYPVNLSGLGDLVRASVDYRAIYQGTSEYTIVCTTDEDIT